MSLPEGWAQEALADIVTIQRGFDLPHSARRPGPFPVLTAGETGGFHDEGPINGPGLTIGRATNLGKPKWSEGDFWPHNTTMFVKDFKGNLPRWVFHLFENLDLSGFDSGSVQPMLNRNYIAQVPVIVPPIQEQQAIAEVLGALDDKIAANTKLISTADEYCVSVVTKASMLASTFPLSDLAVLRSGYSFKSGDWQETGVPVVKIGNVKPGRIDLKGCSFVSEEVAHQASNFRLRDKDVLIAMTGYVGEVARQRGHRPVLLNQRVGRFDVTDLSRISSDYLYYFLRQSTVKAQFVSKGQGSAQQNIGASEILSIQIGIPDPIELDPITETLTAVDSQIGLLMDENAVLGEMRDALLPQLMSGKLRVKDAEAQISASV